MDSSLQFSTAQEPIAVIGASCRLPGANNPAEFWQLLMAGTDMVRPPSAHRWDIGGHGLDQAGYLDRVDLFDPEFFNISAHEAAAMDPQQRLLLELSWQALEHAQIVPETLRQTETAVFASAIWDDYAELTHRHGSLSYHSFPGTRRTMLANRVSYIFGLRGPSITVDTGQSSSLVAVHQACQTLRNGEASMALVGGVNLMLAPQSTVHSESLGAISPDRRCFTFDARANGYVRGEGGVVLALKPLSQALADGNKVHCVIGGSAVNNDGGGDNLGAPRREAQEDVLRSAYEHAGIDPTVAQYVELHGTGTLLGDRVEAEALGSAIGNHRDSDSPLLVGSVKTNLGHLEGAAGIVGLLKVVLSIVHRQIPPSLNFTTPNPQIPLEALHMRVVTSSGPWPHTREPLVAGVSSFGLGGTNCHLVAAEHTTKDAAAEAAVADRNPVPWVLSARSPQSLQEQASQLQEHLTQQPDFTPATVGYSLATTRTAFRHRAALVGSGGPQLLHGLRALSNGEPVKDLHQAMAQPLGGVAFVFPGQGAQWTGMGIELAKDFRVFAEAMQQCEDALAPYLDISLPEALQSSLDQVDVVQAASWAVMVSLARLWQSFGVEPDVVVGHSQGEIAAAVVAGALSLSDGARVVALRSKAIARKLAGNGGMVSLELSGDEARRMIEQLPVSIAALNGPASTVVSGDEKALEQLISDCVSAEVGARRISVDYASHSSHVEAVETELLDQLADIAPQPGSVPFYSTVTAKQVDTANLHARYWFNNLRQTVRFNDTIRSMLTAGHTHFVEISAHPVLTPAVQDTIEQHGSTAVPLGTLRRDDGGSDRFMAALANAHVAGLSGIDWKVVFGCGSETSSSVDLPTYPLQRTSYWLATAESGGTQSSRTGSPQDGRQRSHESRTDAKVDQDSLSQRLRGSSKQQRHKVLLSLVRDHASALLDLSDGRVLGAESAFREAGFDSVAAVELRNRLNNATGLALPSTIVFRHPTPTQLAQRIADELDKAEQSNVTAAFADLDKVAATLDYLEDESDRERVVERLQSMLRTVGAAEDDDLSEASDEAMFALIDRELGRD